MAIRLPKYVHTVSIRLQRKRKIPGASRFPGPRWQGGILFNPRVRVVRGRRS